MIDYENMRITVVKGLKQYLGCPVIRANQNVQPPSYPYVTYTVTTLMSENGGTWQEYDNGIDRQAVTQTWSISALSNESSESVRLAAMARAWLTRLGTRYLNDNNVIVQSAGNITNRDNILTSEYEYKNGFDVVFWLYDEVENTVRSTEYINELDFNFENI